ncbi:MAG: patatin-like phospholipase family protein [Thermodesulfobacteriota bacterium]
MFKRSKLGLALGAGGARGLAHLGVLKALEEAGVRVSFLAGSSIGALVGAAWLARGSAAEVEKTLADFLSGGYYAESGLALVRDALADKSSTWPGRIDTWLKRVYLQARFVVRPALLDGAMYRRMIEFFIPRVNIEDLPTPFCAVGTDLKTGRPVLFRRGPVQDAVYASVAIPGLVAPLAVNDLLVVDGGVVNMVPIMPVRSLGAEAVLAVDVEKSLELDNDLGSAFDILFRVEEVQNTYIREGQLHQADLILRPRVGHVHWSEFQRAAELIQLGRDEADGRLDEILTLSRRLTLPWRFDRKRPRLPGRDWIEI